jgi:hypothetical protein
MHQTRPPVIDEILTLLERHGVHYVITGSVAAAIHGVELEPGDLDIVPATDLANLERLVRVLFEIEARPRGPFGHWTTEPNGERKWIERPTTAEELAEWRPEPSDLATLDHLYLTRLGNFDVVPEVTGTYESLKPRATQHPANGHHPWVAHVDDLLARLTVPRRDKDVARVAALRQIQQELAESPTDGPDKSAGLS